MFIPLVILFGMMIWAFTTWVKWRIVRRNSQKYQMDPKLLAQMLKGSGVKSTEELLKKFRERRKDEEASKIDASKGKNLFEELEERQKAKRKKTSRVFDPDMFHDPVSRFYAEEQKKKQMKNDLPKNGN